MIRYDNVTFLVCLPRSRSAWLAAFLKPVAWTTHDPLKRCESIDELGLRIDAILAAYPNQTVIDGCRRRDITLESWREYAEDAAVVFNTSTNRVRQA